MNKQWYYLKQGQSRGPVSSETLAEMVVDSKLSKDTPILDPASGTWVPIVSVQELNHLIRNIQHEYYGKMPEDKLLTQVLYNDDELFKRFNMLARQPLFMNTYWRNIPLYMLLTCGLYQLYWLSRQWFRMETLDTKNKSILRKFSLFLLLAPIVIFVSVEGLKEFRRVRLARFNPYILGMMWYVAIILTIYSPFSGNPLLSDILRIVSWMCGMIPIMIAQMYINACNSLLGRDSAVKD